jgi:hypothetical protein
MTRSFSQDDKYFSHTLSEKDDKDFFSVETFQASLRSESSG